MDKQRSVKSFTTLDEFLEHEGVRESLQNIATNEVWTWQIEEAIERAPTSRK